jgi:hypothetical protein
MPFTILDPTESPAPEQDEVGPAGLRKLETLRGARVGLLANGKTNAEALLEAVGALLEREHGARVVARENKRIASRPVPAAVLDRFGGAVDLVVTAVGD